ncbi:hypothetical protein AB1Y20_021952 [Prymnesium parvum]|uniref:Cytosine-specific methyltransferase n=1 Tax=Prymnesium parvum TaxID=97485 RepID=A0AB34JHE5_PRYPA
MAPRPRFTFAECFAGIGGFRLALEALGGKCVFASEYCHFAQATYRANWLDPAGVLVGDIRRIVPSQLPPHDVLVGGFPCQSFSNAGDRLGFDDERGMLFFELIRLISHCRPRAVLLENVRGLLTQHETLREVLEQLGRAGYSAVVRLFDAASLVPQRRKRVFIVGFRNDADLRRFHWPLIPETRRAAEEVLEKNPHPSLELSAHQWNKVESSVYARQHPGAKLLPRHAISQTLQSSYKRGYMLYSQFVPHPPPANPRFFSPRECARLMGFPESFVLPRQEGLAYRQLGNAVCPPLVAALMAAVLTALEDRAIDDRGLHASLGQVEREADYSMEAAALSSQLNLESLSVCLRLTLASSASDRPPQRCCLPAWAFERLSMEGEVCDDAVVAAPSAESLDAATVGAGFHAALPSDWACHSFSAVLARASECCQEAPSQGFADAACHSSMAYHDTKMHSQTLPAPTTVIKGEAAALMRKWSQALLLRSSS